MRTLKKFLPGLLLLLSIAIASTFITDLLPELIGGVIGKVFISVLLGILIANTLKPSRKIFGAGIKFGSSKLLKLGIIFMGVTVSFSNMVKLGPAPILIILILMLLVVCITFLLGKLLGVSFRRKLLLAVGICICGNSAIVATAPAIEAEEEEVAMAVSIITLFGVLGVMLYPLIGKALGMSDMLFGAWVGMAINDTSQVVAAGQIFSDEAAEIAITIKLIRNIMIVPAVLIASYVYKKYTVKSTDNQESNQKNKKLDIIKLFPMFVLGFLGMAIINSLGLFSFELFGKAINLWFKEISKFLILLALSGIGLGVVFKRMKSIGLKPFILGFAVEGILAVSALLLNMLFLKGF